MDKKWIALFSQTGSEIVALSHLLGRSPALIITNNMDESKYKYHPDLKKLGSTLMYAKHDRIMHYLNDTVYYQPQSAVITLHGYLRILPPEVCNKFSIYNGHPGLITSFPELKGKDPQIRAWEGKYHTIGSVVHRVTPGVDEGEVISSVAYTNRCESIDEMYGCLKKSSLESWQWVLKGILV